MFSNLEHTFNKQWNDTVLLAVENCKHMHLHYYHFAKMLLQAFIKVQMLSYNSKHKRSIFSYVPVHTGCMQIKCHETVEEL